MASLANFLGILLLFTVVLHEAHGAWSVWGAWGACTVTCDGGVMTRTRTCDSEPCTGNEVDYAPCNHNDCPTDGVWGEWGGWGLCTQTCAGGTQTRTRGCIGPYQGGAPCVGDEDESQDCNQFNCPIHGGWTLWTEFTSCSQTCGGGVQERTRTCTNPAPQYGGFGCSEDGNDFRTCNTDPCPGSDVVDGNWGPWSLVGSCSTTCGPGIKTRERSCTNPAPDNGGEDCPGESSQEFDCTDEHPPCPVNGNWGWWVDWETCSQPCDAEGTGPGTQIRYRYCEDPYPAHGGLNCTDEHLPGTQWQERECGGDPCPVTDGVWGAWEDVGTCSRTCGGGQRVRTRDCDNPAPAFGGRICPDGDEENPDTQTVIVGCNFGPCPVHGGWSVWTEYSVCSVTCGSGIQTRTRECDTPLPEHGGRECAGEGEENIACDLEVCHVDGEWGSWAGYSACSVTCGGGERMRERWCDNPPPSGNGTECDGDNTQTEVCGTEDCPPRDGAWSRWQTWGPCTVSCGGGLRTRVRNCDSPPPEFGGRSCPGSSTQGEACSTETCPPDSLVVDGAWSGWTVWSRCSRTCGGGQRRRVRTCTDPEPSGGGEACDNMMQQITREAEIIFCNSRDCPIDGGWSGWSEWGECTERCGGGTQTKSRKCDSPAPENGGQICVGANFYSGTEVMTQPCNLLDCADLPPATVSPGGPTVTPTGTRPRGNGTSTTALPSCPEEEAWDGRRWPLTYLGLTVSMPCPEPATGTADRKCASPNTWSPIDTSECRTPQFNQLQDTAKQAALNTTAREILLSTFRDVCSPEVVDLAGDLLSCKNVFEHLVNMDIPGDPKIDHWEKSDFLASVVSGVSQVVDKGNKELWYIIVQGEEEDDISILYEFTRGMETLGKQVARHLAREKRNNMCKSAANIALCVQVLRCSTSGYRYPLPPPDPTPPPKHIRGGWEAPPLPKISYMSLPDELAREKTCNEEDPYLEPRYAVTIAYDTIHEFLPDEHKKAILREEQISTTTATVEFEDDRTPIAKIVSATIVSDTLNTSHLPTPIDLTFQHTKDGREVQCGFLKVSEETIYGTEGCWIKADSGNSTTCSCNHMTTFVLLGKVGKNEEFVPAGLDKYTLIAGILVILTTLFLIIAYIYLRLYKKDRYFMLLHVYFALLIGHLVHIAGANATSDFHGCRFVIFVVHVCFLAVVYWLLFLSGFLFKQIRDHRPLGLIRRIIYSLLGWGIPFVLSVVTLGLGYDIYYHDRDVCWLGWEGNVNLSFALPMFLVVILSIIILAIAHYHSNKMTEQNGDNSPIPGQIDFNNLLGFIRRVLGLVLLIFIIWIFFWLYTMLIIFLVLEAALCVYLILAFVAFDMDVKRAFKRRKTEREAARREKLNRPPTPEEPEWVTKMKRDRDLQKAREEQKMKELGLMDEAEINAKPLPQIQKYAYIHK